jgi:hypothetical protein
VIVGNERGYHHVNVGSLVVAEELLMLVLHWSGGEVVNVEV